ncbi:hypothetical protein U1Q18_007044 [Sarracenia purpurea var. burkii]
MKNLPSKGVGIGDERPQMMRVLVSHLSLCVGRYNRGDKTVVGERRKKKGEGFNVKGGKCEGHVARWVGGTGFQP